MGETGYCCIRDIADALGFGATGLNDAKGFRKRSIYAGLLDTGGSKRGRSIYAQPPEWFCGIVLRWRPTDSLYWLQSEYEIGIGRIGFTAEEIAPLRLSTGILRGSAQRHPLDSALPRSHRIP